jgi:hypothetical protein
MRTRQIRYAVWYCAIAITAGVSVARAGTRVLEQWAKMKICQPCDEMAVVHHMSLPHGFRSFSAKRSHAKG